MAGPLGDTWTWDGAVWRGATGTGPSSRYGAALAHDAARDDFVLFGGQTAKGASNETSTWQRCSAVGVHGCAWGVGLLRGEGSPCLPYQQGNRYSADRQSADGFASAALTAHFLPHSQATIQERVRLR
jgi:hypothetical protein